MSRDDDAKLSEPERQDLDLRDRAPSHPERGPVTRNNDQAIGVNAIAQSTSRSINAHGTAKPTDEPIGKWRKFWQGVLHVDTSKMELGIGFRKIITSFST